MFLSLCLSLPLTAQSPDQGLNLGRMMSIQFEREARLSTDRETLALVDRIGQTLSRISNSQIPIVTRVVDSDEINVWILPGGYLYVTRGMIGAAGSEAELAAVMAQGIARMTVSLLLPGMGKMTGAVAQAMGVPMSTPGSVTKQVLDAAKLPLNFTPVPVPQGTHCAIPLLRVPIPAGKNFTIQRVTPSPSTDPKIDPKMVIKPAIPPCAGKP